MKLMPYVKKLEGKKSTERKHIITSLLNKLRFDFKLEKYNYLGFKGENIIIDIGKGKKDILIVSHYDVVPGSPGANDNASAIAVVFSLLKKLKNYKPRNKLKFIIFNDEELECLGSRSYIKQHGTKNIIAVYNMELVGMGDAIGLWPITKDIKQSAALNCLRKSIKKLGYYHEEIGELPLFYGDYKPFKQAGIKDAFCISIVPKKEKEAIRKFVETPRFLLFLKIGLGLTKIPQFFKLYHNKEDKSKYLNESALQMTSNVLFDALISLDKTT